MWFFVALFIAALVVSFAIQPKIQSQKPAGLSEIDAPIAQEGVEIPVLFGTRDLNGPNVVWYGDLKTVAIKSKGGKK